MELARAGADVVVNYFGSEAAAAETVGEIKALGRQSIAVQANVFEQSGIDKLVAEAEAFFPNGNIDILVRTRLLCGPLAPV